VRTVPPSLSAVAWDHASMIDAYKNTLTDLYTSHMGSRLTTLIVGDNVQEYFAANPSEVAAFTTFFAAVQTHAHTLWTSASFVVTIGFDFGVVTAGYYLASGATYSSLHALVDVHAFSYDLPDAAFWDDLVLVTAILIQSAKFLFYKLHCTSAAAASSSDAIQSATILAAVSYLEAFNALAATDKITRVTFAQLNDFSTAVLTSAGFSGTEYDYLSGIGLIDTTYVEKDVWVPLVTILNGDPGLAGNPPPGALTLITPADGATNQPTLPSLQAMATNALSYSIKFGTAYPPTAETFLGAVGQYTPPTPLVNSTVYYHQWIAHNAGGDTTGPVWSFTTSAAVSQVHPKLLITPAYRARMALMKADYEAAPSAPATLGGRWYKYALEVSNGGYGGYPDAGWVPSNYHVFDAWMYQATGEQVYADRAWTNSQSFVVSMNAAGVPNANFKFTGNQSREYMITWVLVYDWCYTGFTQAQRDQYLTQLNAVATQLNVELPESFSDHDQPLGDYFGMACLHEATKDYNPHIVTKFADSRWGTPELTPTPPPAGPIGSVCRTIIYYQYALVSDGYWMEGSEYSEGSSRLGLLGRACLQTTSAASFFPEIDAWTNARAHYMIHEITPNSQQKAQWGDDENPRSLRLAQNAYTTFSMLLGILTDLDAKAKIRKRLDDLIAISGIFVSGRFPLDKALLLVDPYVTPAANLDDVPLQRWHPSGGLLFRRTGNDVNDSHFFFHARCEKPASVDHGVAYQGSYQLYRRGEWVWTGPVAYTTGLRESPKVAPANNCVAIEGLTHIRLSPYFSPQQYDKVKIQKSGAYYELVECTRGGMRWATGTTPPPRYVHEYTRGVLYVTTPDKTMDLVIVFDRLNALDPESLPRFTQYNGYGPTTQTLIAANPRWESFIQHRVDIAPVYTSRVCAWTTLVNGQLCRDVWLTPTDVTIQIQDLDDVTLYYLNTPTYAASERKFRARVTPVSNVQWNPLLYTRSVRNAGVPAPVETLLTVSDGGIGCHITRAGNFDVVFIGNGTQGADIVSLYPTQAECEAVLETVTLRSTGYSTTFTVVGGACDIYLVHLNPALAWTISINGAPQPLIVDVQGVSVLNIVGAGVKDISVSTP